MGSGADGASCVTVGEVRRVEGASSGSDVGTNSVTVPVTSTRAANAAAAGGALDVKTKIASDVFGSASKSASASCTKKPFGVTPVTTP